jgi:hypothetical protein
VPQARDFMPRTPGIFYSDQALRALLASPRGGRELLMREIERLRNNWDQPSAIMIRDGEGRDLTVTLVRPWTITWWLHPVDWEICILRIELVR